MAVSLRKRASGLLLHISSLPSRSGIGDFGSQAFRFIDMLEKSCQSYWQVLPLNPTIPSKARSPYAPASAFAGNTLFISPELLYEDNLAGKEILDTRTGSVNNTGSGKVEFRTVEKNRKKILDIAYEKFKSGFSASLKDDFDSFCLLNKKWLNDYAAFKAFHDFFLKNCKKKGWAYWPPPIRDRETEEIKILAERLSDEISKEKFCQFIFLRQWINLKKYAAEKNIGIIGDVPIYIDFDSSDVWSNRKLFKLDHQKSPAYVSGVPPDYFSSTGQLWNNPVYDWNELKKTDFTWWIDRVEYNLGLFDIIRLDHFRGFISYWEVPAGERTAKNGKWENAYPELFFKKLTERIAKPAVIAENLGVITPDVIKIMQDFKFPGVAILQFAFGKDFPHSGHIPERFGKNTVVYTGTHDNNTLKGWFDHDAKPLEKRNLSKYLGQHPDSKNICCMMIEQAMKSGAILSIIPAQDILCLGSEARMNHPSTVRSNWRWRLSPENFEQLCNSGSTFLAEITAKYGRECRNT